MKPFSFQREPFTKALKKQSRPDSTPKALVQKQDGVQV